MLRAAFGSVAHSAGSQQVACAITAHVPAVSGPSQPRVRQSFDRFAGSRLLLWCKMFFPAARGFRYERQRKKNVRELHTITECLRQTKLYHSYSRTSAGIPLVSSKRGNVGLSTDVSDWSCVGCSLAPPTAWRAECSRHLHQYGASSRGARTS